MVPQQQHGINHHSKPEHTKHRVEQSGDSQGEPPPAGAEPISDQCRPNNCRQRRARNGAQWRAIRICKPRRILEEVRVNPSKCDEQTTEYDSPAGSGRYRCRRGTKRKPCEHYGEHRKYCAVEWVIERECGNTHRGQRNAEARRRRASLWAEARQHCGNCDGCNDVPENRQPRSLVGYRAQAVKYFARGWHASRASNRRAAGAKAFCWSNEARWDWSARHVPSPALMCTRV